jgi:hypothetical protein
MKKYYLCTLVQQNGDREVHTDGCLHLPKPEHRIDLGSHVSCHSAVTLAKKTYQQVNGCIYCCLACHTQ